MMRSLALSMAVALIAVVPACGDDVPFAAPSPPEGSISSSLADLMTLVQMRHIKIAYAGKAQNWDLVRFEAAQMQEGLTKAALHYVGIPVEFIIAAAQPLNDIRDAAAAKDSRKLTQAYAALTTACNSCHTAGGIGFIHIQTPTSNPFSDQAD